MPTSVEYAVVKQWHAQNGSAGGPPAQNPVLAHNVADASPSNPADGWLPGGLPAVLLLAVAAVAWRRRRRDLAGVPAAASRLR